MYHNDDDDVKHGRARSLEYWRWAAMKARCYNTQSLKYKNYGGRGIQICDRWMSFAAFFEDMGEIPEGMTLDRINVNGNYEPSNCRWATPKTQSNNKTNNRTVTIGCVTLTLAEWGREMGFSTGLVSNRIQAGWGDVDAATRRVSIKNRKKNEESKACE